MSRQSRLHQTVAERVKAAALSKVATVALVEGKKVLSHHKDFSEANIALCAALDKFYGGGAMDGCPHHFDIVPLSTVPEVGTDYDARDRVWLP